MDEPEVGNYVNLNLTGSFLDAPWLIDIGYISKTLLFLKQSNENIV